MLQLNTSDISKNINDFSFVNELINEINNEGFKNNVFYHTLSNDTQYSNIYNTISAISEDIGNKLYEETLNYIDNIGNIDICKTYALQSMLKMLGLNYNVFSIINRFPDELIELINIFSIRSDYLLNSNIVSKYIYENMQLSCLSDNLSENSLSIINHIDKDKLDEFIKNIFRSQLEKICLHTYYDDLSISNILTQEETYIRYITNNHNIVEYTQVYKNSITELKYKYKIDKNFDEKSIVDDIEQGILKLDDFTEGQQIILNEEIKYRKAPYKSNKLTSRYKYFKEQLIQKYIDAIEYIYINLAEDTYKNYNIYDVNPNYIYDIKQNNISLLKKDSSNLVVIDFDIIELVCEQLLRITNIVRELRNIVKTHVQKNYMKGTFILLSYIINEYLKLNYNIENSITEKNIELIEYYDTTNYFNISTDIDNKYQLTGTNQQYWGQNLTLSTFIDLDITNIFNKSNFLTTKNYSIVSNDIENFYRNTIQIDFSTLPIDKSYSEHLNSFLYTLFDYAANKTFMSNDVIYSPSPELSTENIKLFNKYTNTKDGIVPYFYYGNTVHPSYQIHPYLRSFIQSRNYSSIIENTIFAFDKSIYKIVLNNINELVNSYGYLQNVQYNPYNFNQTYLSRYEKLSQKYISNIDKYPVIGYDGFAYPKALRDYFENTYSFTDLNTINNRWYRQLNLSYDEKKYISTQLKEFKQYISKVAGINNEYYDIYKYGKDIFGNSYILVKNYENEISNIDINETDTYEIPEEVKSSIPGTLWVKYKDHPIAFPFIVYQNNQLLDISQVEIKNQALNMHFKTLCDASSTDPLLANIPAIYDFQILDNQQVIVLKSQNDSEQLIIPFNISLIENSKIKYKIEAKSLLINENNILNLDNTVRYKNIYKYTDTDYLMFLMQQKDDTKLLISGLILDSADLQTSYRSTLTTEINISCDFNIENIQLDVNNNKLYIAHLSSTENLTNLTTYFSNTLSVEYLELSSYIDVLDNSIIIREFEIGNQTFIENIENNKSYLPLTDMGFYPLIESHLLSSDNIISEFGTTVAYNRAQQDGLAKFQIIGQQIENGIEFKHVTNIVKKFEIDNTDDDILSTISYYPYEPSSNISVMDYRYTSFIETPNKLDVKFSKPIFDKNDFYSQLDDVISNDNIYDATNRIFETNINLVDKYVEFPYLVQGQIPYYFKYPGTIERNSTQPSIDLSRSTISQINLNPSYSSPLSISWLSTDYGIKIDFNSKYYNEQIAASVDNLFNYQHTFLNLDKPGDSGYLKIYKNSISSATSMNEFDDMNNIEDILYIKNISDRFPKFILSSMYFNENIINSIDVLACNEFDINIGQSPEILLADSIENHTDITPLTIK